jgi:hypothetical protein
VVSRRAFVLGATAGGAALVLAGCGGDEKPAEAAADPLKQVQTAAVKTVSTSFHVTLSAPRVEVSGDVDPVGQALTLDITVQEGDGSPVRQKVRVVGAQGYVALGKTYVPDIDPTKYIQFTAPSPAFTSASLVHLADPFDPAGLKGLVFGFTGARRTAGGSFTGTLDLTKALYGTSRGLLPADPEQLRGAGDVVTDIPFEAAVDDDGYLTSMTVRMPAYGSVPAYPSTSTFTKFDEHVKVEPPQAAEITEITEELRQILTG